MRAGGRRGSAPSSYHSSLSPLPLSSDLREQLQASLAGSYTVERELGGGGMSRVFIATETRFKRPVVVKVLHPDLAAGVSVERFEREIALAAACGGSISGRGSVRWRERTSSRRWLRVASAGRQPSSPSAMARRIRFRAEVPPRPSSPPPMPPRTPVSHTVACLGDRRGVDRWTEARPSPEHRPRRRSNGGRRPRIVCNSLLFPPPNP